MADFVEIGLEVLVIGFTYVVEDVAGLVGRHRWLGISG